MKIQRNEIVTGTLVLVTFGALLAVVLALGAPGAFQSLSTYYVFFDNAGGMKPGTDVLLAGRHVGQVLGLQSPVPVGKRPPDHKDCEVLVEVRVRKDAKIYRSVSVRMEQYGLLGQQMIDFVRGDEESGLAESGAVFVGERVAGLNEVAEQAAAALGDMKKTLGNLNELTGESGDLRKTLRNASDFTETIRREPWRLIWRSRKRDTSR